MFSPYLSYNNISSYIEEGYIYLDAGCRGRDNGENSDGSSYDGGAPWGTLLVAFLIRWGVLKIGGAKAVRSKLMPFFIGVFAGCVVSVGIFTLVNGNAVAQGNANFYNLIP